MICTAAVEEEGDLRRSGLGAGKAELNKNG